MSFPSPLASPLRTSRNLTPFRGRGRGGGQPSTPISLAPYAWYDVHAGGTSTTITDSSGNGRAAATFGAATAAPLFLPYTGIPYVHLEAAATGTNSVSCTAPANTASYSASPLGGGAPSTGAAVAGAFAFTTAGDWVTISLLDAGAVELARFIAADCTQTGVTDSHAVAWTVNRGTAGRKTVVLSPVAGSTRSTILFGTNDLIAVPAAAVPPLNIANSMTVVAVFRKWSTNPSGARVFDNRNSATETVAGFGFRSGLGTPADPAVNVGDGTTAYSSTNTGLFANGVRIVGGIRVTGATVQGLANATTGWTSATRTGNSTSANALTIGATGVPSVYNDMQFGGLITFNRAITTDEMAFLVAYYGGGS